MEESEKMNPPKVYFQFGNLRLDQSFLLESFKGSNWKENILKALPEIEKVFESKNKEEAMKSYLIGEYRKHFDKICDSVINYQEAWEPKNDLFMKVLSKVIEVEPPKNKNIMAYVGLNPVAPRYWLNWSFCIHYNRTKERAIKTTAHETVHFFYFKKLMEEFPSIDKKTFDSPHLEWRLSEILAPIILNDPRIIKSIGKTSLETYACDDKTRETFNQLYKKHLKKKTSFIEFYKEAKKMVECMPKK